MTAGAIGAEGRGGAGETFVAFLRLGCISFGGPVAHLGHFRTEFVERRRWLGDRAYADIVALCQFLPGPASSQVGMAIGLGRAGLPGLLAAWAGFTLPSAVLMVAFAWLVGSLGGRLDGDWLDGLKIAAVAVVALAVLGMARSLTPDLPRALIATAAAATVLAWPMPWVPLLALAAGAGVGLAALRARAAPSAGETAPVTAGGHGMAIAALGLFAALLAGLPLLAAATGSHAVGLADAFYRAGALIFGGGHVVLPLLEAAVVPPGWIAADPFLAGYGAAQALPGPITSFAAYLGALMQPAPGGIAGALLCTVAIFLPSMLLVAGAMPFWAGLRQLPAAQAALRGLNAVVVGILAAALYDPLWKTAIHGLPDVALAAAALWALLLGAPSWLVVGLAAGAGTALAGLGG